MDFEQYYPTIKFQERDILLSEFEEAQKIANTQNKLYNQLASLLLTFATIVVTLLFKTSDDSQNNIVNFANEHIISFNIFVFSIGVIILKYFSELQKTIIINSRKVITIRRLLGLDYGNLQLTIPNWRVEGATNPFVIKLFPGWFRFNSSPFWIISITVCTLFYFSINWIEIDFIKTNWLLISIFIIFLYSLIFRLPLNDTHESFYLNFVRLISKILFVKLLNNFEYILYRAKLAVFEQERLNYQIENIKHLVVSIEDKRFFNHHGVDFKSIIRSVLSFSKKYRDKNKILKSGGSTLNMQLCRTLFIPANQNKFRRKIIEILLAFWINNQFDKNTLIKLYLASVRYEKKVNGLISASKFFFELNNRKTFSDEEAFFLVERLSNISSTYSLNRIDVLYKKLKDEYSLSKEKIISIYEKQESKGLIIKK